MKRAFKCPDCDIDCIGVRWAIHSDGKKTQEYPKPVIESISGKVYWEYRYFCSECKKEWIYNDSPTGYIQEVDEESQFIFDERKGCLVKNRSKD